MFLCRSLPICPLLVLALIVNAGQGQTAKDVYGDPLPAGAIARLGTVRFRHDSAIVFAAFLPGGKSVLSVSDDGVICAWEFPSGKEIGRVKALTNSAAMVSNATLSPDGKHLTAFCDDGFLRIVDWANAKVLGKVASSGGGLASRNTSALSRSLARSLGR